MILPEGVNIIDPDTFTEPVMNKFCDKLFTALAVWANEAVFANEEVVLKDELTVFDALIA